jgi:hypothetical protein
MYKIISDTMVQRLDDGACIPLVEGNRDYAEYLAWLGVVGNEPEPADPPLPPPPVDLQVLSTDTPALASPLAALRSMSPEQVAAWVDANITDLPSAIRGIKLLAVALCITRRQIRGESQ